MPDLLIELFSEEIPARMQGRAAEELRKRMTGGLVEAGLTYASAAAFVTPRRLCLTVEGLLDASPATREERKGPRVGAPEQAIEGFLRGAGVDRANLQIREEKKGEVYFAVIDRPGRPASEIVGEVLEDVIRHFPWPKSMRWGAGSLRWVRPLQSIVCILCKDEGAEILPLELEGLQAGDVTYGHRFLSNGPLKITSFEDYRGKLKSAFVMLDAQERADHIWADATTMAFAKGLEVVEDPGLLAEVAGLVEWPVVLLGQIDPVFLDLPPEVLQTAMKTHQKFLSVRNPKTDKIEGFVTVANLQTADDGATILAGNQRVLFARLSDAAFFWENDLSVARDGMTPWIEDLTRVTFHAKLGSQAQRIARIAALAEALAPKMNAAPEEAAQAARIAKADLSSEMVGEFPELQGLMGRYYAQAAGFDADVGAACEEHYAPLGPSDRVPSKPLSMAVALADKLDMLTGFWLIDEKPTGSKDPFALRRAALGVVRILVENETALALRPILQTAQELVLQAIPGTRAPEVIEDLLTFIHDRLKVYLRDTGLRHDVIDASIAMENNDNLDLLVKRAKALAEVLQTEDGQNLIQGFKRVNNILSQAEAQDGVEYSFGPDVSFAANDAERAVFTALDRAEAAIAPALKSEDFQSAMHAMAELRAPIDAFFEATQINDPNQTLRRNRLNLLHRIRTICGSVADLTRIED